MPTRTTDILLSEIAISDEMKQLINYYIDKRVEEGLALIAAPDVSEVTAKLMASTSFVRKVRVQLQDSLDYSGIVEHASNQIDLDQVVEKILANESSIISSRFHQAIMSNSRFRSVVTHCVNEVLRGLSISDTVEEVVKQNMANNVNESAERAVTIIMQRLTQGADV